MASPKPSLLVLVAFTLFVPFGFSSINAAPDKWDGGGVPSLVWPLESKTVPAKIEKSDPKPVTAVVSKKDLTRVSKITSVNLTPVPEPVSWGLVTIGLVFAMVTRRRSRATAR